MQTESSNAQLVGLDWVQGFGGVEVWPLLQTFSLKEPRRAEPCLTKHIRGS